MKKTNFTNPKWISGWLMALTFLATTIFSVNDATAQYNYFVDDQCTTAFEDISSTGTALNLCDDCETNVSLPFYFNFFGDWYLPLTDLRVGTNGGFLFDNSSGDVWVSNNPLPYGSYDKGIFPFWDDLDYEDFATDNVYWEVKGTEPYRRMIIQWNMLVHFPSTSSTVTMQAVLYEGTNEIKFVYDDVFFDNPLYDYGASATVGIQGSITQAIQYSYNTPSLANGQCISFLPVSTPCSIVINDEVNLSLDALDCETEIHMDMVLEHPLSLGCFPWDYVVEVYNMDGTPLHDPVDNIVNYEQVDQSVLVYVRELNSGNMSEACIVNVFDKKAPFIICPQDTVDIFCFEEDTYTPDAYDNCDTTSVNMIVTNEVIYGNQCNNPVAMPYTVLRYIDRSYVAIDASGNVSDTCDVTIRVNSTPPSLMDEALRFPEWRTVANGNPISCAAEFATTTDGCCESTGYPVPEYSGVPWVRFYNAQTLDFDSIYLYPNGYFPCNITVSYFDLPENSSTPGCVTTFMRMWTVTQWSCTINYVRNYAQIIEIADDNDPEILCPDNVVITTNSIGDFPPTTYGEVDCGATFLFPAPVMSDLCTATELLSWDISVANDMGFPIEFMDNADVNNPPYRVLPLGENTVSYTVYDLCGRSASCDFIVSVVDVTEPVAICQQFTVVGLTYDGYAEVPAYSFDSGSYDDCRVDRMVVRRMDWESLPCGIEEEGAHLFNDYVTFCCADIGTPVTVVFRVYDIFNNYNECMVEVEVQDKLAPVWVDCPDDIRIDCATGQYDVNNLRAYFGWPVAHDNCDVTITTDSIIDINQCGVGTITRYFTATDNGGRTNTNCQQVITIDNMDPFWINEVDPYDLTDDVEWPATYSTEGCLNPSDLHPDVTGWPILFEDQCDLAGATWSDDVFFFNDDDLDALEACFKIIRHWKVIDWCQHEADNQGQYRTWTYDQIVMVTDSDGPTITSDCEDKTTCTYDPDCEDGYIELTMSATDICTDGEDLKWHYGIDYNDDNEYGSFDWDSDVINGANIQALGEFNNGEFPIGTHRIYWTVWDQCGNASVCDHLFTIQNCKTPTPYCLDNIATTLMGVDTDGDGETDWGMVEVTAIDCAPCCLDAYHPCTYDIAISFSDDPDDNVRVFDCNDVVELQEVEIWATAFLPDGSVTQDYCVTHIDIQDNFDVCANGPDQMVEISGTIMNVEGGPIAGTTVELDGSELGPQMTGADGAYSFTATSHGSYNVIPQKDGDDTEGVTTLDLVLIQKHLLALKEMDSPYTIIAADVDANGKVSAADLFTLRQLILGINESFNDLDSWAFIDGSYQFENPGNPFNETYPVTYQMDNVTQDMNIDFVGVKMGDINHTVALSGGQDVVNRSEALQLIMDEDRFENGQVIEVPVFAANFEAINGFQLTLQFDATSLEFTNIESGVLNIGMNNLGLTKLNNGSIAMSWSEADAQTLSESDVLFTLHFNTLKSNRISEVLSANSRIADKQAYTKDLSVIDLSLETRNAETVEFELYQNTPNPFSEVTNISFNLPEAGFATLKIQDVTGRIIKVINGDFNKGLNTIQLDKATLNATGILYYQLDSEGNTATKRMVVIQ